jgi:hypothetical protein
VKAQAVAQIENGIVTLASIQAGAILIPVRCATNSLRLLHDRRFRGRCLAIKNKAVGHRRTNSACSRKKKEQQVA